MAPERQMCLGFSDNIKGTWDVMDDDESVGGWHETERMKKILNQRGPGWDEMGDDEDVGNAWTNGWLRHYCAGGPTLEKWQNGFDIARWQQVPDKTEEEVPQSLSQNVERLCEEVSLRGPGLVEDQD